jgi:glycosyltransferase involved in cell wall biosynthesis
MYKDKRVAVVIPAYNVENHVLQVVRSIQDFVDHIIVVDDASQDRTYDRCKDFDDKRLIVLRNPKNLGVGGATITGFKMAMKLEADVVIKMDGDGQMDAVHLKKLIEPLVAEGYSYTKGNRFLHSQAMETMPKLRLLGNFAMTFMTKLTSGYWHIFDPQNGYIAIRKSALDNLEFDKISKRYFFENDMLINLNIHNYRVKDIPIPANYGNQPSFLKIHRVLLSFPLYLFKRFWYRIYQKYV